MPVITFLSMNQTGKYTKSAMVRRQRGQTEKFAKLTICSDCGKLGSLYGKSMISFIDTYSNPCYNKWANWKG